MRWPRRLRTRADDSPTTGARRLIVVVALALSGVLAPAVAGPATPASAADLSYFDPGNIIADAVFYDALSMNANDVQSFLNAKGSSCVAGQMPCLKDYRQDTVGIAGDEMCPGYTAGSQESAAVIITKVAVSCGISPRVLLVLLQKEQSLPTVSQPSAWAYQAATGYACPDSGHCDPSVAGFQNQVYWAAWQYRRYQVHPTEYSYQATGTYDIAYNYNSACGTESVYIQNPATAGLYDYTPYVPNQAALNAGYGTGDNCSSYGNRNFWNLFTDWFGSTQSAGGTAIYTAYEALGGASGELGAPAQSFVCGLRDGGCFQVFRFGSLYWSPATGAHAIMGDVGAGWAARGWERGALGYPVGEVLCGLANGGCRQVFQGGSLYWSPPSGSAYTNGPVEAAWESTGTQDGPLGYPVADVACGLAQGGCAQPFQRGWLFWSSATGAHTIAGDVGAGYLARGAQNGALGYPVGELLCGLVDGGCRQVFQGGSLYWSTGSGTGYTDGSVEAAWESTGTQDGPLGYPVADVACGLVGGGCWQPFQRGIMYWSPASGGHAVRGDLGAAWLNAGAQNSTLGYPVGDLLCGLRDSGCLQQFQHARMYWTPTTGADWFRGEIITGYEAASAQDGVLGYATGDEICGLRNGGCFTTFQGGSIYWSPTTGSHAVTGAIRAAWGNQGWETGSWGYPTGDATTSGTLTTQHFQGGTATLDTTTNQVSFR